MINDESWKELYRYWRSRCIDGRPPARAELDIPLEVPQLIANIMLVEIVGDRFRYRLVGTTLYERYQMELTGTWIEARNAPEADWRSTLALVRDDRIPRLLSAPVPGYSDRFHVAVALPLAGSDGRTDQILAGTFFAQEYGGNLRVGQVQIREILGDHP